VVEWRGPIERTVQMRGRRNDGFITKDVRDCFKKNGVGRPLKLMF
jgi:predicted transcriptional regulator